MPIHQQTQSQMIARMFGNLSEQLDIQQQPNSNLQEQINLLSSESIKNKKCILAILEANLKTMARLMNELKPNENTDGEDEETENESEN